MPKFMVELAGSFYTYELYNDAGAHIYDLTEAVNCAEDQFGEDWQAVYNGNEGEEREECLTYEA